MAVGDDVGHKGRMENRHFLVTISRSEKNTGFSAFASDPPILKI
jgi:hypothetical protein